LQGADWNAIDNERRCRIVIVRRYSQNLHFNSVCLATALFCRGTGSNTDIRVIFDFDGNASNSYRVYAAVALLEARATGMGFTVTPAFRGKYTRLANMNEKYALVGVDGVLWRPLTGLPAATRPGSNLIVTA
jgi:hypothetical protein